MIDLHCHILPGLDDGAKDWEESLRMCRIAVKEGIKKIVATPHTGNGVYRNSAAEILGKTAELNYRLKQENISLEIIPGADAHLGKDFVRKILNHEVLTIADQKKYVLLELPAQLVPEEIKKIIFDLQIEGIRPIISHPERNWEIQSNPGRAEELVGLGVILQLTAASLTGGFGPKAKICGQKLLQNGLVSILSSDAHSDQQRPPKMVDALAAAEKIIGKQRAADLVETFPQAIIEGQKLDGNY
ncbi:MAG: CpsB/CapC family capsule biosynthesis tyrosine phosphatase [Elusimicrobiota bacterium]